MPLYQPAVRQYFGDGLIDISRFLHRDSRAGRNRCRIFADFYLCSRFRFCWQTQPRLGHRQAAPANSLESGGMPLARRLSTQMGRPTHTAHPECALQFKRGPATAIRSLGGPRHLRGSSSIQTLARCRLDHHTHKRRFLWLWSGTEQKRTLPMQTASSVS